MRSKVRPAAPAARFHRLRFNLNWHAPHVYCAYAVMAEAIKDFCAPTIYLSPHEMIRRDLVARAMSNHNFYFMHDFRVIKRLKSKSYD